MATTSAAMTMWSGCGESPSLGRHGRTCSGHPRLSSLKRRKQDVDGRDKRGHDGLRSRSSKQYFVQIFPFRIQSVDESDFPGSRPMLHRFFSLDGIAHVVKCFVVDQHLQSIATCEAVDQPLAMFETAFRQICGNAGIKNAI